MVSSHYTGIIHKMCVVCDVTCIYNVCMRVILVRWPHRNSPISLHIMHILGKSRWWLRVESSFRGIIKPIDLAANCILGFVGTLVRALAPLPISGWDRRFGIPTLDLIFLQHGSLERTKEQGEISRVRFGEECMLCRTPAVG